MPHEHNERDRSDFLPNHVKEWTIPINVDIRSRTPNEAYALPSRKHRVWPVTFRTARNRPSEWYTLVDALEDVWFTILDIFDITINGAIVEFGNVACRHKIKMIAEKGLRITSALGKELDEVRRYKKCAS